MLTVLYTRAATLPFNRHNPDSSNDEEKCKSYNLDTGQMGRNPSTREESREYNNTFAKGIDRSSRTRERPNKLSRSNN